MFLKYNFLLCVFVNLFVFGYSENVIIPRIGTIVGSTTNTIWTNKLVYQYLGIKYALSPSGDRRFKIPESAVNGEEKLIIAEKHGIPCPSFNNFNEPNKKQLQDDLEDCLHLSVYTKNLTSRLPTMVYIHGGALEQGSTKDHPPGFLLEKDIVLVALQYRLGPLGFLSTETDEIPGNFGYHDVLMALNWVKDYVQYFGGDPNQITIFGESAGSMLVSALVLNPKVPENLFQRAIMQSGSYFAPWSFNPNPVSNAKEFASFTACEKTESIADINKCFQTLPVNQLVEAFDIYQEFRTKNVVSALPAFPLVRSEILPLSPFDLLFNNRTIKNIDLLAGTNKHDGVFLAAGAIKQINDTVGLHNTMYNKYDLIDNYLKVIGIIDESGTVKAYLELILFNQEIMIKGDFLEMLPGLKDIANTFLFKAPALQHAKFHANKYPKKTFLYTFDYKGDHSHSTNMHEWFADGVHHAEDLLYLFPMIAELNKRDREFATKMVDLWTSFAIDGIPKANGISIWPPLTSYTGPYLHLNEKATVGTDFIDEFTVVTHEANGSTKNSCLSLLSLLIVIVLKFM